MARKFNNADPTANTAIANVDKKRRTAATLTPAKQRNGRRILEEFPDAFAGLLPHEARQVALRAHQLAGNDVWAITAEHLAMARKAVGV